MDFKMGEKDESQNYQQPIEIVPEDDFNPETELMSHPPGVIPQFTENSNCVETEDPYLTVIDTTVREIEQQLSELVSADVHVGQEDHTKYGSQEQSGHEVDLFMDLLHENMRGNWRVA